MATLVNTITVSSPETSASEGQQKTAWDSARIDNLSSRFANMDSGRFVNLHVDSAHITTLTANNFTLPSLNVDSGHIATLSSVNFNPSLINADSATITTINATTINAGSLEVAVGSILGMSATYNKLSVGDSANIDNLTTNTLSRNPTGGAITPAVYGLVSGSGAMKKGSILTVDSNGFINGITAHDIQGVESVTFDSASYNLTVNRSTGVNIIRHIHTVTGATPGSYGSTTQVPVITVDKFGHISGVSNVQLDGIASTAWDSANSKFTITQTNGDTQTTIINGWKDDQPIKIGTGNDLTIQHSGGNTSFKNITGQFRMAGNDIRLQSQNHSEDYITMTNGGAVKILHDNSQKMITTLYGATVTGTINADSATIAGDITTGGHILPSADAAKDLGSASKKFRDLYLHGGTIKLGGISLKDSSTGLTIINTSNSAKVPMSLGALTATTATANTFHGDGNALTNFNPAQIRTHVSGGTGVTYNNSSGVIAIGQAVATTSDVTFNDVTIDGDLEVKGSTTTINTATLDVTDKNITIAKNAADAAAANGAGLTIDGASATLTYTSSNDRWNFNKALVVSMVHGNVTGNVTGTVSSIANHTTNNLTENTNLYHTTARARSSIAGNKGLAYNSSTGVMDIDSANVKGMLSGGDGISYNASTGAISTAMADGSVSTQSTSTTNTTANQSIATLSATTYRSMKCTVQASIAASNKYEVTEIHAMHYNGNAWMTQFGTVSNHTSALATYDVDVQSGNMRIVATPSANNMVFKTIKHAIKV